MPKVSQEHLERRRQQILDAAVDCFARQGFHATSMQDIFRASGLSAGAVYRYFPSKHALIRDIAAEVLAGTLTLLDDAIGSAATPGIADVVTSIVRQLSESPLARVRPVIMQVWAEAVRDEELHELSRFLFGQLLASLDRLAQRQVAAGRMPTATDTAAVAHLLLAVIQGYVIQLGVLSEVPLDQVRAGTTAAFGA
jgi:AcrR family transcriptional regulator